jgi:hypothetical protein
MRVLNPIKRALTHVCKVNPYSLDIDECRPWFLLAVDEVLFSADLGALSRLSRVKIKTGLARAAVEGSGRGRDTKLERGDQYVVTLIIFSDILCLIVFHDRHQYTLEDSPYSMTLVVLYSASADRTYMLARTGLISARMKFSLFVCTAAVTNRLALPVKDVNGERPLEVAEDGRMVQTGTELVHAQDRIVPPTAESQKSHQDFVTTRLVFFPLVGLYRIVKKPLWFALPDNQVGRIG